MVFAGKRMLSIKQVYDQQRCCSTQCTNVATDSSDSITSDTVTIYAYPGRVLQPKCLDTVYLKMLNMVDKDLLKHMKDLMFGTTNSAVHTHEENIFFCEKRLMARTLQINNPRFTAIMIDLPLHAVFNIY